MDPPSAPSPSISLDIGTSYTRATYDPDTFPWTPETFERIAFRGGVASTQYEYPAVISVVVDDDGRHDIFAGWSADDSPCSAQTAKFYNLKSTLDCGQQNKAARRAIYHGLLRLKALGVHMTPSMLHVEYLKLL